MLKYSVALTLCLLVWQSSASSINLEDVRTDLLQGRIQLVPFASLYNDLFVQSQSRPLLTCSIPNLLNGVVVKRPCMFNEVVVGQDNQYTCTDVYGCCYNVYESLLHSDVPSCYQTETVNLLLRSSGNSQVLANTIQGNGFGYPAGVKPGKAITTSSESNGLLPPATPLTAAVRSFTFENQRLSYYLEKATYSEAAARCRTSSSNLLIMSSPQLQAAVIRHLRDEIGVLPPETWENEFAPGYWIGGSDSEIEGTWRWINRSTIPTDSETEGYENWYRRDGIREPDASTPLDDCLYVSGRVFIGVYRETLGSWFDDPCTARKYFICQTLLRQEMPIQASTSSTTNLRSTTDCCTVQQESRRPCGNSETNELECITILGCCYDAINSACYLPLDPSACNRVRSQTQPVPAQNRRSGWYEWTQWSRCIRTCGGSTRSRFRGCIGSVPGTDICPGNGREVEICSSEPCPGSVLPAWGDWGDFSQCTRTCGRGTRFRLRTCLNGRNCAGSLLDREFCNNHSCPKWGRWGSFSPCQKSCGGGRQVRTRSCLNGQVGQSGCLNLMETISYQDCATAPCVFWSEWTTANSFCTASCGTGVIIRSRICINGEVGVPGCIGLASERIPCSTLPCPFWSEWGGFGECSVTCNGGTQTRIRTCINGEANVDCPGEAFDQINCNGHACERWEDWSEYGSCSSSCGGGIQTRTRSCAGGAHGDRGCLGVKEERRNCNPQLCPSWSSWGRYGQCSSACGNGMQYRYRTCLPRNTPYQLCGWRKRTGRACFVQNICGFSPPILVGPCSATCGEGFQITRKLCPGAFLCHGRYVDERVRCKLRDCPTWSQWSPLVCSVSCGVGSALRTRTCLHGFESECEGSSTRIEKCSLKECATWSPWEPWSICSASCGSGTSSRVRICQFEEVDVSECPGSATQRRSCRLRSCDTWGDWSEYTSCTQTCGGGTQFRSRVCLGNNQFSVCLGSATSSRECNTQNCPFWSEWSNFGECDAPCGGGNQVRTRRCINGIPSQDPGCTGPAEQAIACNTQLCRVWSSWSNFSTCSRSCNNGTSFRTRNCTLNENVTESDQFCVGRRREEITCNTRPCPRWSDFGVFDPCSVSCGRGSRSRSRTCLFGLIGEDGCIGSATDTQVCMTQRCPFWREWSPFGPCSLTCNGGSRNRTRICAFGTAGTIGCEGLATEIQSCNDEPCPNWSSWNMWTACPVTCGAANQSRSRSCLFGEVGDDGCNGNNTESRVCNRGPCPTLTDWSTWSVCSTTCGEGTQQRFRLCINGNFGDDGCRVPRNETRSCLGNPPCAFWSTWSFVGICSVTCGFGVQQRSRMCVDGVIGDDGCQGSDTDEALCIEPACPVWTQWSSWSACNVTCGGGISIRTRSCEDEDPNQVLCGGPSEETRVCSTFDCGLVLEDCNLLDIGFIIDSSSSIGLENFELVRDFIRSVISRIAVGLNRTRFAAIRYNRDVEPLWTFLNSTSTEDLFERVENITYDGRGTRTGQAIEYAALNTFTAAEGDRQNVSDLAIIITDGVSQDVPEDTIDLLKNQTIRVVAIGVTDSVDVAEINEIASDPNDANAFFVRDFRDLPGIVDRIAALACGSEGTTASPANQERTTTILN